MLSGAYAASPAVAGLEICNDTGQDQSVAIGHMVDGTWTSEGWWNIDAGDCAEPVSGDLQNRYYYYRAETTDGQVMGDGSSFCITDDVFTIEGQDGCAERGFDSAGFSQIDTGPTAKEFTLTLAAQNADAIGKRKSIGGTKAETPEPAPVAQDMTSGFQQGSLGEPFTQSAKFQSCGSFDGARYCAFHADGWKWFAYYGGGTPDGFLDQISRLAPGADVEIAGDIVNMGDISVEVALSRVTVQSGASAYGAEFETIQGAWVSNDDPNYRLTVMGSELIETYPGSPDEQSFWRFQNNCDSGVGGSELVIIKTYPETQDSDCFIVVTLTPGQLDLIFVPRGNMLSFRRP